MQTANRIKSFFQNREIDLIKIQNYPAGVIFLETLMHIECFVGNPNLTIQ
jgi:hypothetical protein